MTTFFGFALADSMFSGDCEVSRSVLTLDDVRHFVSAGVLSCLNPSHKPTIEAMRARFGLSVEVPEKAPQVSLGSGDTLVVMSVRGLPRLEGRHEYTAEEVEKANFAFSAWTVK